MTDEQTHEVRILHFPLRVYAKTSEHMEELMREFALLAMRPPDEPGHEVPKRLLDLVATLTEQYAGLTDAPDRLRDEALERGDEYVDLTFHVPTSVAAASRQLDEILDEVDEYCRRGEHLLTLATPPESLAFRKWYLSEFIGQIDGAAPTPWPDYVAATA